MNDEEYQAQLANRYQFKPWYIKVYRWLRWKPLYSFMAICQITKWLLTGAKPDEYFSRAGTAELIWTVHQARAEMKMLFFHTHDEVRERLGIK